MKRHLKKRRLADVGGKPIPWDRGLYDRCRGKWDDLALEHLQLAEKLGDLPEKSMGLFNVGQVYWRIGNWREGEDALRRALNIQEENSLFELMMPTIAILGVIYRNQDKYKQALETYRKGIEIHSGKNLEDQYWLGRIYNNMATALRSMAAEDDQINSEESPHWLKAVDAYEKSLSITTKLKSFRDIGNTYNNLAIVYKSRKSNDLSKAFEYAQKAKENLQRVNAPVDVLDNLRVIGAIYAQSARYNLALLELEQSLSMANEITAKDKIGLAYMEIGTVHHKLGDMNSASYYYREALKVFTNVGAPKRIRYIQNLLDLASHKVDAPVSNPE